MYNTLCTYLRPGIHDIHWPAPRIGFTNRLQHVFILQTSRTKARQRLTAPANSCLKQERNKKLLELYMQCWVMVSINRQINHREQQAQEICPSLAEMSHYWGLTLSNLWWINCGPYIARCFLPTVHCSETLILAIQTTFQQFQPLSSGIWSQTL